LPCSFSIGEQVKLRSELLPHKKPAAPNSKLGSVQMRTVADVYLGMNPLKKTLDSDQGGYRHDRHLYIDLDQGGSTALEAIQNSGHGAAPNFVLQTSPGKHQVVWKVEAIPLEEAEALQRAMVREFGGDPAATDSTRVLRLPFANKKYAADFYVQARVESQRTYQLHDSSSRLIRRNAPGHHHAEPIRRHPTSRYG